MRRLTVAVLAIGSVVAAQNLRTKGTDMEMAHNVPIPELTEAIYARLVAQWEGWKNQDPAPNNAIIADEFDSFWPDGSRHVGRPTAQQMAEQPITGYKLSQFRVVPVGADAALVTYFADVKTPGDNVEPFKMAVGEVWVKHNSQWLIRGYSGTLMKWVDLLPKGSDLALLPLNFLLCFVHPALQDNLGVLVDL